MRTPHIIGIATLAAAAAVLVQAGPLTPPAGPVAPTYKTLSDIEPGTPLSQIPGSSSPMHYISQPGRYYLTGNLNCASGQAGIVVGCPDVTIDLRGFTIRGGATPGDAAIKDTGTDPSRVTIQNGSIVGWGQYGVLNLWGLDWVCRNLSVSDIAGEGLRINAKGVIDACSVKAAATYGVWAGAGSRVSRTTASECGSAGIYAMPGVRIDSCELWRNSGTGITAMVGVMVADCTVTETRLGGGSGRGISLDLNGSVERCVVTWSDGDGIFSSQGGVVVRGCTVDWNKGHGISVYNSSLVTDNHLHANGTIAGGPLPTAGILVRGTATRVDTNHLVSNNTAVKLEGTGNLVVRNSFSANGAHAAGGAGNSVAQIISSPANGFVSTDPWANFNY